MCRIFAESRRSESNSADLSRVRESLMKNYFLNAASRAKCYVRVRGSARNGDSIDVSRITPRAINSPRENDPRCRAGRETNFALQRSGATQFQRVRGGPVRARATSG